MQELDYPFDAERIIKGKKRLKRQLLESGKATVKKKIAVLGGYTTSDIVSCIELFLLNNGIEPVFYESEYDRFYQDAVFDNPELESFAPDIIYICTCVRNISAFPKVSDSRERTDELLNAEAERFRSVWEALESRYHCPIIQNNFEYPLVRRLGNLDRSDYRGAVNFVSRLNAAFDAYALEHEKFYICDVNYISADYGLKKWSDPSYWYLYKYAVAVPAIPYLAFNAANIIKAIFGKNKKGLVLDLDNTIWGGVVGDDGAENLRIGPDTSEGQMYSEFQRYLKGFKDIGVLLNIDSKNDEENALQGLNHPDSILKPEDFIVIKANWENKDSNFRAIASELNLGEDSLVFIDDNPAERHIVREQIPGAGVPELGDVSSFMTDIDRSGFFETVSLSDDDMKRNEMYRENIERDKAVRSFSNYDEYLRSLEMKAEIGPFNPLYIQRIAQLTNKTNQFNLTTRRYTLSEIEDIADSSDYITLYGKLEDRFGDNGVVSLLIGRKDGTTCHMDLWLMSCRVLKRDMELAMADVLADRCLEAGITEIVGYYYPTRKNKMVEDFYASLGFERVSLDEQGNSVWKLPLEGYTHKNTLIEVS